MVNIYDLTQNRRNLGIPDDIQDLVNSIVSGIMTLAARAANSNSDSNSLGGTTPGCYFSVPPSIVNSSK